MFPIFHWPVIDYIKMYIFLCVQTLSSDQSLAQFGAVNSLDSKLLAENFQWLTREQTFVMVYLVS